jgi:hypothetical protein
MRAGCCGVIRAARASSLVVRARPSRSADTIVALAESPTNIAISEMIGPVIIPLRRQLNQGCQYHGSLRYDWESGCHRPLGKRAKRLSPNACLGIDSTGIGVDLAQGPGDFRFVADGCCAYINFSAGEKLQG